MSAPAVTATTARLYGRLPEMYRTADALQTPDFPLLKYLAGLVDQAGAIEEMYEAIDELADPAVAPIAHLAWIAQHVGARLDPAMTEQEKRDAILFAPSGWRAGTTQAIADAAKSVLTGTRYARVYKHAETRSTAGSDAWYHITVVTRPEETPSPELVLDTIIRKGAKPAGVVLHHESYSATWAQVEAAFPTWADWNDVQWRDLEETT